jgi:hypothetical protein
MPENKCNDDHKKKDSNGFHLKMDVDRELDAFDFFMKHELYTQLSLYLNRNYWEELDELDDDSLNHISATVRSIFEYLSNKYKYNDDVVNISNHAVDILEKVTRASMNVPYPRDYILHIEYVVNNVYEVYLQLFYADLRTAMILANQNVTPIQKAWRLCVSSPAYMVCRNRLHREFLECI